MREEDKSKNLKKLQTQLKKLAQEKQEYLEGWQRTKAEFINYKRNESNRINEMIKLSTQRVLFKILNVLDDLERLELASQNKDVDCRHLKAGILQIRKKIDQFLTEFNITKIQAKGKEFDPRFHEAIAQVKNPQQQGKVVAEVESGYLMNGELLRPTKVKVAN